MILTYCILLQAGLGGIGEFFAGTWPLFFIVLIFYFMILRPQQKKQKEQDDFIDNLQKGDEVVTASGIIGKVNKIDSQIVTLQVDQKTFMRVTKNAISKDMTESIKLNVKTNESV